VIQHAATPAEAVTAACDVAFCTVMPDRRTQVPLVLMAAPGVDSGAAAVLTKPVRRAQLHAVLLRVLGPPAE